MQQDLRQRLLDKARPVEFRASMRLGGATTLGLGALLGAGLYVLVGLGAAQAGPALWLSYALCGGLTFLTALMYAELARRVPESGGGYLYAYRQLGPFWGFLVGWLLAAGSIFACALYAYGFGSYLGSLLHLRGGGMLGTRGVAVAIVGLLTWTSMRRGEGGQRVMAVLTWGNIAVLLILVALAAFAADGDNLSPHLPHGFAGVGSAFALIYISFFGFQLVANASEEIDDAPRTVPRAMLISLGMALVIYVLVAFVAVAVVPWTTLSGSEAPLVDVAQQALGGWGHLLVAIGGILAAGGALSGTLVAQARQLFAMGRDAFLPRQLGTVHPATGVPAAALVVGGIATVVVVIAADLEDIARAANFSLLAAMLPISFALHRLQRDERERHVLRRALPWAALLANGALLATLGVPTITMGMTVVTAGCIVFIVYSFQAERRGQAGLSVALVDSESLMLPRLRSVERILLPVRNPDTLPQLFAIAQAVLPPDEGEVVALSVVHADADTSLRETLAERGVLAESLGVLEQATALGEAAGVRVRPVVRAARDLAQGIRHAIREERCGLVVMGYSEDDGARPTELIEETIRGTGADYVFLRADAHEVAPREIAALLGGTANLPLIGRVATALAEQNNGRVTYVSVVPHGFDSDRLRHARRVQIDALEQHTRLVPYRTELVTADDPLAAIVELSKVYDLLVVGSAVGSLFKRAELGEFSALVAHEARCPVAIVRVTPRIEAVLPSSGPIAPVRALAVPATRADTEETGSDVPSDEP